MEAFNKILIFSLTGVFILCINSAVSVDGEHVSNKSRIYNGKRSSDLITLGFAQLLISYNSQLGSVRYSCGGSLIDYRYVLTAAHCIYSQNLRSFPSEVRVSIGKSTPDLDRDIVRALKIIIPKTLDKDTFIPDVALLEIPDVRKKPDINASPVQISMKNEDVPKVGRPLYAAGFGLTKEKSGSRVREKPTHLMQVKLYRHERSKCRKQKEKRDGGSVDNMRASFLCASGKNFPTASKAGTCSGDSGGPVFILKGNRYVQIGVSTITWNKCGDKNSVNWIYLTTPIAEYISRRMSEKDRYYWESVPLVST